MINNVPRVTRSSLFSRGSSEQCKPHISRLTENCSGRRIRREISTVGTAGRRNERIGEMARYSVERREGTTGTLHWIVDHKESTLIERFRNQDRAYARMMELNAAEYLRHNNT